jgi:hypothetical protein
MLAVGLETGDILLFTSIDAVNWHTSLEIKAGYVASATRVNISFIIG